MRNRIRKWFWTRMCVATVVGSALGLTTDAGADTASWTPVPGDTYNWNDNANWSAAFPNADTDIPSVNNNITGDQIINLNQNITIANLNIGDSDGSHTFTIASGTGGAIQFSNNNNRRIEVTNNSTVTISADMQQGTGFLTMDTNTGGALTVSGDISGGVNLIMAGTGTVTLAGNNTHTGYSRFDTNSTTIVANDNALGAGTIFFNNGRLQSIDSSTRTFSHALIFANARFGGTGDFDFTYTGDTDLSQLRTVDVADVTTTFATSFTGVGAIQKTGSGTLLLTGDSTFTGASAVVAGTFVAASNNALGTADSGTNVFAGGTLAFQGGINYTTAETLDISGSGDAGNSRAGALDNLSGNNTFAGNIEIGNNTTIGASADSLTLTGSIIGGGTDRTLTFNTIGDINVTGTVGSGVAGSHITTITKNGGGTLTLAGANLNNNTVTVNQGTLLANNTIGSATGTGAVAVNDGGVLGGTGTITPTGSNGITVADGAAIAPGASASIGTLTINLGSTTGTVNMLSDAEFKFELGTAGTFVAPGASDRLSIVGAVTDSVVFNNNIVTFTGGDLGTYKLFDSDLANSTQAGDTWSGLTYNETTGLVTSGLVASGAVGDFFVGTAANGGDAGDIYFNVVPEPSTFVMLLGGLGMLLGFQRARRLAAEVIGMM